MSTATPTAGAPGIVVFAYDFPHRKTQDVLVRLALEGIDVAMVIGAPRIDLGIPPATVRTRVRSGRPLHPAQVAAALGMAYTSAAHDAPDTLALLRVIDPDVGLVAGARVLPSSVIAAFSTGIVNLHPGLIPGARGLDALLWSILEDVPLGVTAHLIDERVDAGRLILRRPLPVYEDDTVFDLAERTYAAQLDLLPDAIAGATTATDFDELGPYHSKMPPHLEEQAIARVTAYVRNRATGAG